MNEGEQMPGGTADIEVKGAEKDPAGFLDFCRDRLRLREDEYAAAQAAIAPELQRIEQQKGELKSRPPRVMETLQRDAMYKIFEALKSIFEARLRQTIDAAKLDFDTNTIISEISELGNTGNHHLIPVLHSKFPTIFNSEDAKIFAGLSAGVKPALVKELERKFAA